MKFFENIIDFQYIPKGFISSYAQFTIKTIYRNLLASYLTKNNLKKVQKYYLV